MFDPTEQKIAAEEYYEDLAAEEAQAQAEFEAERAAERWFEERGGNYENQIEEDMRHSPFDPIWQF